MESRRIIEDALVDADKIRSGADEYAVSVLDGLEGDVQKTLLSIQKGIAMLDDRRATLLDIEPPVDPGRNDFEDGDWQDQPEDASAPVRS